jgi:hypothetical protein
MRKPLALVTIAALSIVLSACGGSSPTAVKPSQTPRPTASATPSATPTAKLAQPSRTRPLVSFTDPAILGYCPDEPAVHFDGKAAAIEKATICTSVPTASGTTESASWVNFGLDALLSAYGEPNQPITREQCIRVATDPLIVWLTTTKGTIYPVYAPVDGCGYPSPGAIDAYKSTGLQILNEAAFDSNGNPVEAQ